MNEMIVSHTKSFLILGFSLAPYCRIMLDKPLEHSGLEVLQQEASDKVIKQVLYSDKAWIISFKLNNPVLLL